MVLGVISVRENMHAKPVPGKEHGKAGKTAEQQCTFRDDLGHGRRERGPPGQRDTTNLPDSRVYSMKINHTESPIRHSRARRFPGIP